jgi:hypothetical protein
MLVFVQVSSMKTSRPMAMRGWYFLQDTRFLATSGLCCSLA